MINKKFNFICDIDNRYIHTYYGNEDSYFNMSIPLLKILKKMYENNNKTYLILELNEDMDFDDEIKNFINKINKIHEICQEETLINSDKWFGKKFDIFDLDRIIKRPIETQKNINYIKLIIEPHIFDSLISYTKNNITCDIYFKGLKITRGNMVEEWYISKIIDIENIDVPEGIENTEGPEGIENTEGPEGIENIDGIENTEGPEGPEGPDGLNGPDAPEGIEDVDAPEDIENREGPNTPEDIEGVEDIEYPNAPDDIQNIDAVDSPNTHESLDSTESVNAIESLEDKESAESVSYSNIEEINNNLIKLDQDVNEKLKLYKEQEIEDTQKSRKFKKQKKIKIIARTKVYSFV